MLLWDRNWKMVMFVSNSLNSKKSIKTLGEKKLCFFIYYKILSSCFNNSIKEGVKVSN